MNSDNSRPAGLGVGCNLQMRMNNLRGIFSQGAQGNSTENYTRLDLELLRSFKEHPFYVKDDEEFQELVQSIKKLGVQDAILVRPVGEDGEYEIIAGHRRT